MPVYDVHNTSSWSSAPGTLAVATPKGFSDNLLCRDCAGGGISFEWEHRRWGVAFAKRVRPLSLALGHYMATVAQKPKRPSTHLGLGWATTEEGTNEVVYPPGVSDYYTFTHFWFWPVRDAVNLSCAEFYRAVVAEERAGAAEWLNVISALRSLHGDLPVQDLYPLSREMLLVERDMATGDAVTASKRLNLMKRMYAI